jgi:23S rRNA (cytidine1920-2'-O)/16S rRNA (cytidine1409-2'-O)-methyltransferase
VSSRERAQSLILAGKVRIGDEPADKPGRMVAEDADVSVAEDPNPYVSRGGLKLAQALKEFSIDPSGQTAVDVGASTGGFTDCLLQKGVAKVFAVDVGYGQLDWKLQSDDRVVMIDRTNARQLSLGELGGEAVDLAVIDVAFISLKLILPAVFKILKPGGQWIALVKPQFEVGKDEVENKGVITDLNKHVKVLLELKQFIEASGWCLAQVCRSPITGQKGNQEYLIHGMQHNTKSGVDEIFIRETVGI